MSCEYVREYYGVPAVIGRRVVVSGKPGVIAADRGHYIGVNFDADRPGLIRNCHPTSEVEYGELGPVRKPSKGAARYDEYCESECSEGFAWWLGINVPVVEIDYGWGSRKTRYRYVRRTAYGWSDLCGDWALTKREAKASYKAALKARHDQERAWSRAADQSAIQSEGGAK